MSEGAHDISLLRVGSERWKQHMERLGLQREWLPHYGRHIELERGNCRASSVQLIPGAAL